MHLSTDRRDELVRQLIESSLYLDFLRNAWCREPGVFGLELLAGRLRDLAEEMKTN